MTLHAHALALAWRKAIQPLTASRVNSVARKLEPKLKRRFLAAVATMKGNVDLEALAESLRIQSAAEAMTALHPETWGATLRPSADILPLTFHQAGQAAASLLTSQLGIGISFNLTNPRAVQWARTNSSRLITEVAESVKDSVRAVISDGFTSGIAPRESARLIRDIVGLTDRQAMAVINYRFDLLEAGRSADDVSRLAERYGKQLLNGRALTIARTETIASSTNGQQELWRQAVDKGLLDPDKTWRSWITTPDDRLCEFCEPMDGQTVGLEEPFTSGDGATVMVPPLHPQCLTGDAVITPGGRITAHTERRYDGDLLVIRTSAGHEIACSPNHPILTPDGWLGAHALAVGGYVICGDLRQWKTASNVNHQHMPAMFHEIADTCRRSRKMMSAEVPVSAEDFDGDGKGSKVAIIRTHRLLRNTDDSALAQPLVELAFKRARVAYRALSRLSRMAFMLPSQGTAQDGSVGGLHLAFALDGGHALPLNEFGLAGRALPDTSVLQSAVYGAPRTSESLRQLIGRISGAITSRKFFGRQGDVRFIGGRLGSSNGFSPLAQPAREGAAGDAALVSEIHRGASGPVSLDQIVSVHSMVFHGMLHNLETERHVYSANGIITHNCRCAVGLSFTAPKAV